MDPSLLEKCRSRLINGLNAIGIQSSLTDSQYQQLLDYIQLLHKWNRAYNLTAIRDPLQMIDKHLLDSLSVAPYINSERVIDVGTGPGLPGIPLSILYPHKRFTLLDSNGKKTRFLQQVKMEMDLQNIHIHNGRVESHQPEELYEEVISRAFASLQDMLTWTQSICAEKGRFLAMKGQYPAEELEQLPPEYKLLESHRLDVPGTDAERHLLIITKVC
nr:16S rRNA (guanine(527)-N(7))-methyltransferase RsmG [Motiliproteus sp. MSK22-1]